MIVKRVFLPAIIIILVILNLLLIYRIRINNRLNYDKIVNYKNEITVYISTLKDNLKFNFELSGKELKNILITVDKQPISNILNVDSTYVVMYYSMDVCEVCEEDIYKVLSKFTLKYPNKFIVIVPEVKYSSLLNSLIENKLDINIVIPYKNEVVEQFGFYRRAIFFTLDSQFKINDVFIPSKPLFEDDLKTYLESVIKKSFKKSFN